MVLAEIRWPLPAASRVYNKISKSRESRESRESRKSRKERKERKEEDEGAATVQQEYALM
jgi:hypothetical protein